MKQPESKPSSWKQRWENWLVEGDAKKDTLAASDFGRGCSMGCQPAAGQGVAHLAVEFPAVRAGAVDLGQPWLYRRSGAWAGQGGAIAASAGGAKPGWGCRRGNFGAPRPKGGRRAGIAAVGSYALDSFARGKNKAETLALKAKAARLEALATGEPFKVPDDVLKQAPNVVENGAAGVGKQKPRIADCCRHCA